MSSSVNRHVVLHFGSCSTLAIEAKKNEAPETIKAKEFSGAAGRNRPNLHDHHYGTR